MLCPFPVCVNPFFSRALAAPVHHGITQNTRVQLWSQGSSREDTGEGELKTRTHTARTPHARTHRHTDTRTQRTAFYSITYNYMYSQATPTITAFCTMANCTQDTALAMLWLGYGLTRPSMSTAMRRWHLLTDCKLVTAQFVDVFQHSIRDNLSSWITHCFRTSTAGRFES